jgi:long-subunit acyl-CoA synthetase (AMP-forming)/pyrroloquinoline quinone (PQQ) biosynthesis protein C
MTMLLDKIRQHGETQPNKIALAGGDKTVAYGELNGQVEARSQALRAAGCRVLGIAGDNGADWVLWDLAAIAASVTTVPLPPFFTAQQMQHAMQTAGVTHIAQGESLKATGITDASPAPAGTAKITFTSGTTGTPKGVCLSQPALENVARSICDRLGAGLVRNHVSVLPLSILLENVAGVYAALMMGVTVHLPSLGTLGFADPFNPDFVRLAGQIAPVQEASIILVPELLRGLLAAAQRGGMTFPNLVFVAVGGARVAPELLQAAHRAGLPAYEGYGLSECGSVVSLNTPRAEKPGTCGKLLPHVQATVRDGEIIIENPGFLGYLGGGGDMSRFATGDLGAIDGDGFVTVSGRSKNVIITSYGRNVSPEWIESLLLAQLGVRQALVFGDGEARLRALVVPLPGADIAGVVARVNKQLPEYAHIGSYEETQPFTAADGTLTANGRPIRHAILKRHMKGTNMSFYERLKQETMPVRQGLYAVPQLQDALQGRISRETYIAYLTEAYHHVRHTVRFLMAMGARLPENKKWLHDAISEYITEEKGHEEWILNDIAAAGGDKEAARAATPRLETEVLVAYNYDYIARKNPVGFLGMVFMLESTSVEIASAGAKSLQEGLGLPKTAFTYLSSHGALDVSHMKFFEGLANKITDPEDQAAILEVAKNTFRLFTGVLAAIPHRRAQRDAA